jgi:hypothetical protein
VTNPGPAAHSSTVHTAPPFSSAATTVAALEAETVAVVRISSASTAFAARSSTVRVSTWTGTPSGGPSSRCPRMFSITPTPADDIPILPTMPASVRVSTRWPLGWSIVQRSQLSAIASCQSHVCSPIGSPLEVTSPRHAMVEHSPRPAQSSSVRAFSAPIASTLTPLPCAMPSISSTRSGAKVPMRSSASAPKRAMSAWPRPVFTSNSRS